MRRSSILALTRAAILVLLVGVLGAGSATAHHHDEATPPDSCGLCTHAASVAITSGPAPSFDRTPRSACPTAPGPVDTEEGCRAEPRGHGPPLTAPVL